MVRLKNLLIDILVKHTGKERDVIIADLERDYFMGAEDTVGYGLVDKVLVRDEAE
jgi:ATP-dependent Clp protease protease subunit